MRNPEPNDPNEEEKEAAMFKKASKHISRSGTTPVKVLFSIEVKTVALKSISDLVDGRYPAQPLFHRPFYHFSFYLYITDVLSFFLFPTTHSIHRCPLPSTINVCFERSGKLAATKDQSLLVDGNLLNANFDQTLSLVVTLYKNADGTYQEKTGKLIVRQPKLSMMGGEERVYIALLHMK